MVRRHETQVFLLMRCCYIFSGAANFALYDFVTAEGWVDENVFAYSNRSGDERAIILYNNAYNTTRGAIHISTAINIGESEQPVLVRRSLAEALALNTDDNCLYAFRDYQSDLEYVRHARELAEQGLFAELHAYQYHAFLDFREIHDSDGSWRELAGRLRGAGVPNLHEAHRELLAEPVLIPYRALVNPDMLRELTAYSTKSRGKFNSAANSFFEAVRLTTGADTAVQPVVRAFLTKLDALATAETPSGGKDNRLARDKTATRSQSASRPQLGHVGFAWLTLNAIAEFRPAQSRTPAASFVADRVDQWVLEKAIREAFENLLPDKDAAYWDSRLVPLLVKHADLVRPMEAHTLSDGLRQALQDGAVKEYLSVHTAEGIVWLNKERLERMTQALELVSGLSIERDDPDGQTRLAEIKTNAAKLISGAAEAGYRVEKLLELLT